MIEGAKKVTGVLFSFVLDAKIVHNEGEGDRAMPVAPEAGCELVGVVAELCDMFRWILIDE